MQYFKKSDQILTYADLFTDISTNKEILSLGFILQKMPGCSEEYLSNVFQAINHSKEWESIKSRASSNYLLVLLIHYLNLFI